MSFSFSAAGWLEHLAKPGQPPLTKISGFGGDWQI